MLNEMERKITAVVADGLTSRPQLAVVEAPSDAVPANPGDGTIRVSLKELNPEAGFARDQVTFPDKTRSRRVLTVAFGVTLDFFRRPELGAADGLLSARARLLDDMSLASHNLSAEDVRNGAAFRTAAPDPGFEVLSFDLSAGVVPPDVVNGVLTAQLEYAGRAYIWPPGVVQPERIIRTIDAATQPLPIQIAVSRPVVRAGTTAQVRIRSLSANRSLAIAVASDLPPAQRGSITSGTAGAEAGSRIVPVTPPETVVTYQAPSGDLGATRVEYVAVHMATPDGRRGLFLGSAAVNLEPGGP